jgi:signal transduction histidine kinase
MSHELRTPLNAIINFTKFVSSGMFGTVNDEQVEALEKVSESGKHLLSLINDLLDISKIEAGALKLFWENNIDLSQDLERISTTAQGLIVDKPITLTLDVDANTPTINGDKRRLYQIMLNIVSNACKFTERGEIHVALRRQVDCVIFSVKDTGPGIEESEQANVFETFRQTNTGLSRGEGTGLGMAISKRLTEAHGGRIWLESSPGEGSSFYVSLPINLDVQT